MGIIIVRQKRKENAEQPCDPSNNSHLKIPTHVPLKYFPTKEKVIHFLKDIFPRLGC